MSAKKTSGALMTSLILHGVAVLILGVYLVTQTPQFKDLVGAQVLELPEPPKPQVRKPVIKQIKPNIPTDNTVVVEQVQVQPRVTTTAVVRTKSLEPQTVLEFSNKVVKLNQPINPNVPKVVNTRSITTSMRWEDHRLGSISSGLVQKHENAISLKESPLVKNFRCC